MPQIRVTLQAHERFKALTERAPGARSLGDVVDLLSYAQPRHLLDIMAAATEAEEEAAREREHAKRVEEAKQLAPRILDGLEAAGTPVDQWIVQGQHDGGPLMKEVLRLADERRKAEGAGE